MSKDELKLERIPLMELEEVFDNIADFGDESSDVGYSINTDKQHKSFKCKKCGKNVSRYNDALRHYLAKHYLPVTDREKEYVRACGGII